MKTKAVVSLDAEALDRVEELVKRGRYKTVSAFVQAATAEKLARLRQEELAADVERYCREGRANEDNDLVHAQAFPWVKRPRTKRAKPAAR